MKNFTPSGKNGKTLFSWKILGFYFTKLEFKHTYGFFNFRKWRVPDDLGFTVIGIC